MEAINTNHAELIGILLSYGADVTLKDGQGRTALDIAKKKRNQEAIALLSNP